MGGGGDGVENGRVEGQMMSTCVCVLYVCVGLGIEVGMKNKLATDNDHETV